MGNTVGAGNAYRNFFGGRNWQTLAAKWQRGAKYSLWPYELGDFLEERLRRWNNLRPSDSKLFMWCNFLNFPNSSGFPHLTRRMTVSGWGLVALSFRKLLLFWHLFPVLLILSHSFNASLWVSVCSLLGYPLKMGLSLGSSTISYISISCCLFPLRHAANTFYI